MNLKYQKARNLMVEHQLRPNKIKDDIILNIFKETPKEYFMPKESEFMCYSDSDIKISDNRGYLKNLHIAQLIHFSNIDKSHKILHLGALTGYVSVLLAALCSEVFVIETQKANKIALEKNIKDLNIRNITVVNGSFRDGFEKNAPYDLIFIDNPIYEKWFNISLLNQINNNMGKIIMIEKDSSHLSQAIKITKNNNNTSKEYLFDVFSKYILYEEKKGFEF
jgi:protein-L-isoaspartate(D-aspartate) O-methyltransferase